MPLATSVWCDECPKVKGENDNNWHTVLVANAGFIIQPYYDSTPDAMKRFFCSLGCLLDNLKCWIGEHDGKVQNPCT